MSMPKIPDLNPDVNLEIKDTIGMLLSSIALEEIGLSHIINAEAEKIQFVLGTLEKNNNDKSKPYKLDDILKINKSVNRTLNGVLQNQLLLQMKLQDTIDLYDRYLSAEEVNGCNAEYLGGGEYDEKCKY